RGIEVVPDILANAGGVIASYYEWTQSLQGLDEISEDTADRVGTRIRDSFAAVRTMSTERDVSLREASLMLATQRVVDTHRSRGLHP
ncbi:MAG: glutamate dehydrogenase, partial [Actinomycetota bacterium]|nr:glutamate dehydrogenase [Actinomycetota bacterium]